MRNNLRIVSAIVMLLLMGSVGLMAQPPLTITSAGYFITQVDDQGVPSLVQLTTVIDLTQEDTPAPPDLTGVDLAVAATVKEWADAANQPQGAQAIAAVYSHVKGAVEDSIVSPVTVWDVLKDATDSSISISKSSGWADFRSKLSAMVTLDRQKGLLDSPAAISRFLRSVQHGLELSADGSTALELDLLVAIAAKTNEAIDAHK